MTAAAIRAALSVSAPAGRFITINVMWLGFAIWAYGMGYLEFVFVADTTRISYIIALVLAVTLALAASGRTAHLKDAAWLAEFLGFAGTVIGFAMGMRGIDAGSLSTLEGLIGAGSSMFAGAGAAFCSTITGVFASLWIWSVEKAIAARANSPC